MEAAARWEYLENTHYVVFNGKVLIIDQTTHKVMMDLDASTEKQSGESRWNGGLAQALEAKHADQGLIIRADSESSQSLSAQQLYERWVNYDSVVGASGTANGKGKLFAQQGLSDKIHNVERYYESRLNEHDDEVFAYSQAKLDAIAADTAKMQNIKPKNEDRPPGESDQPGQPQLILVHDNALVRELSQRLNTLNVAHTPVDAHWFLERWERGEDSMREFQDIVDKAGEPGKVLVVNMQGARGVDIPISEKALELGGLHVRVTARSSISHDIDIQAENRAARSGQAGSVEYYISPEDDLIRLSHNPNVTLAVTRYTKAVEAHTADTTPQTADAVHQAADVLRKLIRPLQTDLAEPVDTQMPPTHQPNAPPAHDDLDPTETTPQQQPHPTRSASAPDRRPDRGRNCAAGQRPRAALAHRAGRHRHTHGLHRHTHLADRLWLVLQGDDALRRRRRARPGQGPARHRAAATGTKRGHHQPEHPASYRVRDGSPAHGGRDPRSAAGSQQ